MDANKLYKACVSFLKQAQDNSDPAWSDSNSPEWKKRVSEPLEQDDPFTAHLKEQNRLYYEEETKHADVSDEELQKKIGVLVAFISKYQPIKVSIESEESWGPGRVEINIEFAGKNSKIQSGQRFAGKKRMALLETLMYLREIAFNL